MTGTTVIACLVVGEGCDEARSRHVEVTQAGSHTSFQLNDLQEATYTLFAVKDTNNGEVGDAGDYLGVYGTDGQVQAPAHGLEFHMSMVGEGGSNPSPQPNPQPYSVSGTARDTYGNPLPNVLVQVVPAVTAGLIEVRTDANGRYTLTDLPNVPYYVYGFTEVDYKGQRFCLRLAQSDYSTFIPEQGVVRDFQLQVTGAIGDLQGRYFGGTFKVYMFGAYANHGKAIEFTFTSTGPLIDGSAGSSFTRTVPLGSPAHLDINDIPVGPYTVSVTLIGYDDSRSPIKMGPDILNTPYEQVTTDWSPIEGCYASSGIAFNYVWLSNPGE